MAVLLDSNVLIALAVTDHVHHDAAEAWFVGVSGSFATCPITEGSLVRAGVRLGGGAASVIEFLRAISADARHEFWPDDVPFTAVRLHGVIGHRQVTDAYLAQLARQQQGQLATFDRGMAALHGDVAELVPA